QINVDVRENAISGETKRVEKYEEGNIHIQEHSYGSFIRAISLPRNVKTSDITAKFEQAIIPPILPEPTVNEIPILRFKDGAILSRTTWKRAYRD
ncbi:4100_t:CDS:2, partial [Dentiscutata heterogama]